MRNQKGSDLLADMQKLYATSFPAANDLLVATLLMVAAVLICVMWCRWGALDGGNGFDLCDVGLVVP